jgi:hypothetical protein
MPRKTGMSIKLSNQGNSYLEKLHGIAFPADVPMDIYRLVAQARALSEKRGETTAIGKTDAAAVQRVSNLRDEALAETRKKFSVRTWTALQNRDSKFFDHVSKAIKSNVPSILHTLILRVVAMKGEQAVKSLTSSQMRDEVRRLFNRKDGNSPRYDFSTRKIADACNSLGIPLSKGKVTN